MQQNTPFMQFTYETLADLNHRQKLVHELRLMEIAVQTTLYLCIGSALKSIRAEKRLRYACVTLLSMVLTLSKSLEMTLGKSWLGLYHCVEALKCSSLNRDRVVCVMTTGQAWQFRPYKWPEPKQLFHHGAYLKQLNESRLVSDVEFSQ